MSSGFWILECNYHSYIPPDVFTPTPGAVSSLRPKRQLLKKAEAELAECQELLPLRVKVLWELVAGNYC